MNIDTNYLKMPKDIADILVYFRPLFPHQETDWEEQIISFGYTTSPKEKETKIRGGFASKYEEPILNCRVSLAGNWKILTLAYLEDMKQGKDHSLEILEKHILQKRKNHFDYNKSLNWLFEHHRAQKLFTRCVNFDDGVKKLFKLATTDLIQDTAEGLIFRASTSEYFSQPILIKQTIVNEYKSCEAFIFSRHTVGCFVNLKYADLKGFSSLALDLENIE